MAVNSEATTADHAGPPPESLAMVAVKVRIPAAHADALARLADENDRTAAAELRRAVRWYLTTQT